MFPVHQPKGNPGNMTEDITAPSLILKINSKMETCPLVCVWWTDGLDTPISRGYKNMSMRESWWSTQLWTCLLCPSLAGSGFALPPVCAGILWAPHWGPTSACNPYSTHAQCPGPSGASHPSIATLSPCLPIFSFLLQLSRRHLNLEEKFSEWIL